jgi:hypothetical protein
VVAKEIASLNRFGSGLEWPVSYRESSLYTVEMVQSKHGLRKSSRTELSQTRYIT